MLQQFIKEILREFIEPNLGVINDFVANKKQAGESTYSVEELRELTKAWFAENPQLQQKVPLPIDYRNKVVKAKLKAQGLTLKTTPKSL
jgi:hypothetical protein